MVKKKAKTADFDVEIGNEKGNEWRRSKINTLKAAADRHIANRTPEQVLENKFTAIRFKMQEYALNQEKQELISLEIFLKNFLTELHMPLNRFARAIDTTDSNLKKYLNGSRKLNPVLALKFGSFFRMSPDLWLQVQLKNQLIELSAEKKRVSKYKRYDYIKFITAKEIQKDSPNSKKARSKTQVLVKG